MKEIKIRKYDYDERTENKTRYLHFDQDEAMKEPVPETQSDLSDGPHPPSRRSTAETFSNLS